MKDICIQFYIIKKILRNNPEIDPHYEVYKFSCNSDPKFIKTFYAFQFEINNAIDNGIDPDAFVAAEIIQDIYQGKSFSNLMSWDIDTNIKLMSVKERI